MKKIPVILTVAALTVASAHAEEPADAWEPSGEPSFSSPATVEHPVGSSNGKNAHAPIHGWLGRLDEESASGGPPVSSPFEHGVRWNGQTQGDGSISAPQKNHTLTTKHFWARDGQPASSTSFNVSVTATPKASGIAHITGSPFEWSPTITIKDEQPVVSYEANGQTIQLQATLTNNVRANMVGTAVPDQTPPSTPTTYTASFVPPDPTGQNPSAASTGDFDGAYTLPASGDPSAVTVEYKVNITGCKTSARNVNPVHWKQFLDVDFTSSVE